jgi:NAD(P)-dependent dehydrogenase (short-subunit alcohol dehydrogenase family)
MYAAKPELILSFTATMLLLQWGPNWQRSTILKQKHIRSMVGHAVGLRSAIFYNALTNISAVTSYEEVGKAVEQVVKDFSKIDCFIANSGAAVSKGLLESSVEEYKMQMAVNGQ